MPRWRVALALLSVPGLAGCFNYHAARHVDVPVAAPIDWPSRDDSVLQPLADATPNAIYMIELDPDHQPAGGTSLPDDATHPSAEPIIPAYILLDSRLAAGGLLRMYEEPTEPEPISSYFEALTYGFRRNASYISSNWFQRFGERTIRRAREEADSPLVKALRSGPGYRPARPTAAEVLLTGSNIALGIPTKAAGEQGILVHIPALIGNKYEQDVVDSLEAGGWTILHVESDTHLRGPGYQARYDAELARRKRIGELTHDHPDAPELKGTMDSRGHFHVELNDEERRAYMRILDEARAQAAEEIPMPEVGFEIHPGDDLEAKGVLIAEWVNQHLADHAYAAQAGVELIDDRLPELATKPIIVIGFSAGSLAAPTVTARLRERYPDRLSAVILIGSGAPILDVARLSTLTNGGLQLTPEGGPVPSEAAINELRSHYLRHASLDPWNVAPTLAGIPILHIYAAGDRIVPVSTALALNKRLGSPDRLVYSGGHLGLFYFLPSRRPRIHLWLERAIESTRTGDEP